MKTFLALALLFGLGCSGSSSTSGSSTRALASTASAPDEPARDTNPSTGATQQPPEAAGPEEPREAEADEAAAAPPELGPVDHSSRPCSWGATARPHQRHATTLS